MIRALEIHPCGCAQVCPVGPGARPAEAAAGCATEHLGTPGEPVCATRTEAQTRFVVPTVVQGFDVLIGIRLLLLEAG